MRTFLLFSLAGLAACTKSGDSGSSAGNLIPIANAGTTISQPADQVVNLDGHDSYDPEGDKLKYYWSFSTVPAGSVVDKEPGAFSANESADAAGTSFHPDKVGVYVIELIVTDSVPQPSEPAYVVVDAEDATNVPIADAGADQTINLGDTATLSGLGSSDPLGLGALTYAWTLTDEPYDSTLTTASITGADSVSPTVVPDVVGDYTIALTVSNTMASSNPDSVIIHVGGTNEAPTANAGKDITGSDCSTISLDCSGSKDPENDTLQYFWELQSKPSASSTSNKTFSDRTAAKPTFYADQAGDYTFSCSVWDGANWSAPSLVTATLAERAANSPPVAKAGADRTEAAGSAKCTADGYQYDCSSCAALDVDLGKDGEASDPDGDPIVIAWTVDTSTAKITDDTVVTTTASLPKSKPDEPDKCVDTPYTFTLSVTDCPGETSTDSVVIQSECCGTSS